MQNDIQITGLTRKSGPKRNAAGHTIIADFDCLVNGMRLRGCALVKTDRGGLTAWAPKIEVEGGRRRTVDFVADGLRHAVMMSARDAYRALGGTDVDCIGASKPIGPYALQSRQDEEAL